MTASCSSLYIASRKPLASGWDSRPAHTAPCATSTHIALDFPIVLAPLDHEFHETWELASPSLPLWMERALISVQLNRTDEW